MSRPCWLKGTVTEDALILYVGDPAARGHNSEPHKDGKQSRRAGGERRHRIVVLF
jgi:hypothetical protein